MVAIINYGAGNLRSVQKAFEYIGQEALITDNPKEILTASHVVLPGVGSFGSCMDSIRKSNLEDCIKEVINRGTPFLGICLGLQLLFEASDEDPDATGLGILKGRCVKIPSSDGIKIPHIGWNSLTFPKESPLFSGIADNAFVYFVHSYYMQPEDNSVVSAVCNYSADLPVALSRGNLHATQFHPEKSGSVGLKILKNFVESGGNK